MSAACDVLWPHIHLYAKLYEYNKHNLFYGHLSSEVASALISPDSVPVRGAPINQALKMELYRELWKETGQASWTHHLLEHQQVKENTGTNTTLSTILTGII